MRKHSHTSIVESVITIVYIAGFLSLFTITMINVANHI